jgi:putative nucleotidyltransferase with HDIG domain
LARLYRASGSLISGASLSLQDLAQSIVAVVQQEFGQANCSLLVVSRGSNELYRLAAAGPYTGQVKNKKLSLDGQGLVPQAIRTGATLNVGDVHSRPDYVSNWEAAQSELAIPLKIGNNVIGVIDIQSSEWQAFSPDDERLMSTFAERAALVLEHSRLNTQTEKHMQELQALRTIDMAISKSFDITMTLGILMEQIIRLLGIHAVDILAFNANTQTFKFSCERGFRTHTLQHMQINFCAGYAWSLVRERQMIVVPDIRAEADGLQRTPDLSGEQFVTYVGMPLLAKGQVKGILEIFQREPLMLQPEGYAFLEMLAGQAAIAIDNSELFEHLQSSNAELGMAYDSTLEGWASALELRDKETEGHTRRVAELATRLAQTMGVSDNDILQIYRGALLHDIGKMGVPDSIVLKPGPLTEEEWVIMRKHPQYAADMLSPIAYLRLALDIPYCHHEKWDGTGYPRGLRGGQIPMSARIFAVVDVWDALTSDRPYRKAWQKQEAVQYIQEQSGRHFDPEVVKAFLVPSFKWE